VGLGERGGGQREQPECVPLMEMERYYCCKMCCPTHTHTHTYIYTYTHTHTPTRHYFTLGAHIPRTFSSSKATGSAGGRASSCASSTSCTSPSAGGGCAEGSSCCELVIPRQRREEREVRGERRKKVWPLCVCVCVLSRVDCDRCVFMDEYTNDTHIH
jgi:hypothetical protein